MMNDESIVEIIVTPYTVHCTKMQHIFSMTRHNVKTRKEFMKHQLLPSPPERSETEREERRKNRQGGETESFPAVEKQRKRMDEECRRTRERARERKSKKAP